MWILQIIKINKNFGALSANVDVDLDVKRNSIHAIIGPNGSGKTTLINQITGIYKPTSGIIRFEGRDIAGVKPHVINKYGIARTFQVVRIFNEMTVLENLMVGDHSQIGFQLLDTFFRPPFKRPSGEKQLRLRAEILCEKLALKDDLNKAGKELSLIQQRRLEIARALASKPRLLLLDEPTAGMTVAESLEIQELIKNLNENEGITIVFIAHDMGLVMSVAQTITVLFFGKKLAEGTPPEIQNNKDVVTAYLGE